MRTTFPWLSKSTGPTCDINSAYQWKLLWYFTRVLQTYPHCAALLPLVSNTQRISLKRVEPQRLQFRVFVHTEKLNQLVIILVVVLKGYNWKKKSAFYMLNPSECFGVNSRDLWNEKQSGEARQTVTGAASRHQAPPAPLPQALPGFAGCDRVCPDCREVSCQRQPQSQSA